MVGSGFAGLAGGCMRGAGAMLGVHGITHAHMVLCVLHVMSRVCIYIQYAESPYKGI